MSLPQPPPIPITQATLEDESQLKLLSVFHYVLGGLYCLGILFLVLHFGTMAYILKTVEAEQSNIQAAGIAAELAEKEEAEGQPENLGEVEAPLVESEILPAPDHSPAPSPREIIWIFSIFYFVIGVMILALTTCNILSAGWLKKRKNRTFSLITAGLNSTVFPFGTALGVFTFIVLSRQTVKISYQARKQV